MARRPLNPFALSFLDCMCCGFGAVILVFMIISNKIKVESERKLEDLLADRAMLESRTQAGESLLAELRGQLADAFAEQAVATQLAERIRADLAEAKQELRSERERAGDAGRSLEEQKAKLAELEQLSGDAGAMADQVGRQLRTVVGEGDRQYLTGMRMGGRRILILVDASASMLDSTIVNVVRLRFRPDAEKLQAWKWKRAVDTVDWLSANLPATSSFQIYTFGVEAKPVLGEEGGGWLEAGDGTKPTEAVARLRKTVPAGGTSLYAAFSAVASMNPRPDNVYLLIDGLPTQGASPPRRPTVSGKERLENFERAVRRLPGGIPVNVILFPMEGDPYAADSYWRLARATRGSFMSPSRDWP